MGNALVQSATIQLKDQGGGVFGSKAVGGGSGQVTITGSGFGSAPTILVFDRFEKNPVGQQISVTADRGGDWGGSVSYKDRPFTVEHNGVRAIAHYDHSAAPTINKYGLSKLYPQPESDFFVSYKVAVPDGNTFPGAVTERSFPENDAGPPQTYGSSCKLDWVSDGEYHPSSSSDKSDLIVFSHAGGGWLTVGGNNLDIIPVNVGWQWDEWNHIKCLHKADETDPEGPNGVWDFVSTNSTGTYTVGKNNTFTAFAGDRAVDSLSFDRVSVFPWTGNGQSHANSQILIAKYYRAIGDNCAKRVELGNNANYLSCTDTEVIPHDTWSDVSITITPTAQELSGKTHYFVFDKNGDVMKSGGL